MVKRDLSFAGNKRLEGFGLVCWFRGNFEDISPMQSGEIPKIFNNLNTVHLSPDIFPDKTPFMCKFGSI